MSDLRMVIGGLIGVLLMSVALIGYLAATGSPIPDVLQNIAVGALTALAGVLVRPRDEERRHVDRVTGRP